jgi:hypothetical protein
MVFNQQSEVFDTIFDSTRYAESFLYVEYKTLLDIPTFRCKIFNNIIDLEFMKQKFEFFETPDHSDIKEFSDM